MRPPLIGRPPPWKKVWFSSWFPGKQNVKETCKCLFPWMSVSDFVSVLFTLILVSLFSTTFSQWPVPYCRGCLFFFFFFLLLRLFFHLQCLCFCRFMERGDYDLVACAFVKVGFELGWNWLVISSVVVLAWFCLFSLMSCRVMMRYNDSFHALKSVLFYLFSSSLIISLDVSQMWKILFFTDAITWILLTSALLYIYIYTFFLFVFFLFSFSKFYFFYLGVLFFLFSFFILLSCISSSFVFF